MVRNNWEPANKHNCLLGECPVWDHRRKRICWIDILNGEIHYLYPATGEYGCCHIGRVIGSIALTESGDIVAAVEQGFAAIEIAGEKMQVITNVESHLPDNRFNDGKCDPAGRFWAGSMSVSGILGAGSLYSLEKDLTVRTRLTDVTCSNGLAWSPDFKTFYYIDTAEQNVAAFDYNIADGSLGNKRVVVSIPKQTGYPDGMTIDREGMLWIAIWGGSRVIRYDPYAGKELFQIILPVSQVTSCVFGGDDMEDLYITSASTGLSPADLIEQPLAGSLLVIPNTGFKGSESIEFG